MAHLFAAEVDSVWIDFTKGLGAPIGAVLAGSRDFIAKARRLKHVFDGAMRQAGIAAAGCLYTLDHHVFFDVNGMGLDSAKFLDMMEAKGIRLGRVRGQIRAVTHLDVSQSDIDTTVEAVRSISEHCRSN